MVTLKELLLEGDRDLPARIAAALPAALVAMDGRGGARPPADLRVAPGALVTGLAEALDIGLGAILAGAWTTSAVFREQMDKSARAPAKDLFVHLAAHRMTSTHRPHVAILQHGREVARLPFVAAIELIVPHAVVHIAEGVIQHMQTGAIQGAGSVTCGPAVLVQKALDAKAMHGMLTPSGKVIGATFMPRVACCA